MNDVQSAVARIHEGLRHLESAKRDLLRANHELYVDFVIKINEIKEMLGILTDPECTPEILDFEEPFDPEFNPFVWNGERIEATKSVLFAEHIANRRL